MAAYDVATLAECNPRIISILNANPGTFSATVSGQVGAFPTDAEITAALIEADMMVATQGYFQSVNDSLANQFQVTSAPLADRDNVPWHHGTLNKAEVSVSNQNFTTITVANQIPLTAHGLTAGQLVSLQTTGTLPTGLAILINYYVIVITANIISLATSLKNALAGTATPITISTGSGTHTVIAWQIGIKAKNVDDILNAANGMESYVQPGAYDFLFCESDGIMYTTATYARCSYPEYIKTTVLQCNKNETTLLIATGIRILVKNASPAPFEAWINESIRGMQELVTDGQYSAQIQLSEPV